MKITIIEGDDYLAAGKKLSLLISDYKKKGFSVYKISPESKLGISEQISGQSLFKEEKLFILENPNTVSASDSKWLLKNRKKLAGTLIVFGNGLLTTKLKQAKDKEITTETFKLPPLIFAFLNSFYPGNSEKTLQLLHQLIQKEPKEKIIHFLGRHLKDLYWVGKSPQLLPYSQDWRILKMLSQAKKFKKGQIEETISSLAEADVVAKTSDTDIIALLDQIIAGQLE